MEGLARQSGADCGRWGSVELASTGRFDFYRQAKSRFQTLGSLKFLTDDDHLPRDINAEQPLKDMADMPLPAKYLLETEDVHQACVVARSLGLQVVVIGSLTSATNNFGKPGAIYDSEKILAIRPKHKQAEEVPMNLEGQDKQPYLKSSQVKIKRDGAGNPLTITSGPGLVPDDLNSILPNGYWIPLDLTTRNQAQLGAVYATGSMGPSRIRPHEAIKRVVISDGETIRELTGDEIEQHEGLLGLTGAIIEIEFNVFEVPKEQFGFLVPLKVNESDFNEESTWVDKLKILLAKLHPALNLNLEDGKISSEWADGLLDGVEIITKQELLLVLRESASDDSRRLAKQILAQMQKEGSTFMVSITGRAAKNIYELEEHKNNPITQLLELMEEDVVGEMVGIKDFGQFATLREAIPDLAKKEGKTPQNPGEIIYSTSTDINTSLSPSFVEYIEALDPQARISILQEHFAKMLQPYLEYEQELNEIESIVEGVKIIIRRYGHAHTREIDLHTRATVIGQSDNPEAFARANSLVKLANSRLQERLLSLQADPNFVVSHGEKGKPPTLKLMQGGKREEVLNLISSASPTFNWRMAA